MPDVHSPRSAAVAPPIGRQKHGDRERYIAYVLWLIGYPHSTIAKVLCLRKKQVGGIIDKSEYANRAALTIARRTELLKELEDVRFDDGKPLDGGLLDRVEFKVMGA
ncbi:MAG: hypothetical protein DI589_23010 [Shinella sp.]|nr:MAG: hypothetical protein DI589_23010 [Shinella sp.]